MALITFVVGCKGRLAHLKQTLPALARFANARCVVVDYDCPQQSGNWVEQAHPETRVVRVAERPLWGHSEVRNLGGAAVETPWICFSDADIVFDPAFLDRLTPRLRHGCYYVAHDAFIGTAGTVVCTQQDFQRVGGYDEMIRGWGYEDSDFYAMLEVFNVRKDVFAGELVTHLDHDNEVRAQFHQDKDLLNTWLINKAYSIVKRNVAMATRGAVPADLKDYIYLWAKNLTNEGDRHGARAPVPPLKIELSSYKLDEEHTMRVKRAMEFSVEDISNAAGIKVMPWSK